MTDQKSTPEYTAPAKKPIEEQQFYKTNSSNDKYSAYYDETQRDLKANGPSKRPPHPRERHRCDYHLEDFVNSVFDGKATRWGTFTTFSKCLFSKPG
jgi:hypothetical protein